MDHHRYGRKFMKEFVSGLLFGKDTVVNGLVALGILGTIALGCACPKDFGNSGTSNSSNSTSTSNDSTTTDSGGIPADSRLQSMVKETTADFAQAIDTNDFSEIYEKSSTDFKNTYTQDQMKNVFKTFVDKKRLILPSLNKAGDTTAEFSPPPRIRQEQNLDILVLNGKFPTKPLNVKFEYEYVKRAGEWKLLKLIVNM